MVSKEREISLSEEERKFLNLCFKSKNIFSLKGKLMKERLLKKLKVFMKI